MQRTLSLPARAAAFFRACLWWDKPFCKRLFFLALPMILQELMGASLHIIDGMMVSSLGDAAYSAVMQANRFTVLHQILIFGVSTGGAIFLSQHWGAKDIPRMRHAMGLALLAALGISSVFTLAALLLPRQIIGLFLPQGESFEMAVSYLFYVAPSYLLYAVGHIYATGLKASERTFFPMLAGLAGILANTLFNYAFIHGKLGFPALGVKGAALATVISAAITLAMNLAFAYGKRLPAGASLRQMACRDAAFVRKYFKTTAPVILNEGLWALGATMYSIFYGTMGDVNIAATGVNNTINDLMWVFIFALTHTAAIIVGKALGQGDRSLAYLYAKRLLAGTAILGLVMGGLMLLFHNPLISLFSGLSAAALAQARRLLIIASLFIWVRAINCVNVVGVFRSGGDTVYSMLLDGGTMWLLAVPVTGAAALLFHWPLEYVYFCTLLDEFVKFFIGMPHFRKRKWMNILTQSKEAGSLGNP